MPSLQFKGRVFVENFHLGVPFHELTPVRARGMSRKASLHDNLIVEDDNLPAFKALAMRNKVMRFEVWTKRVGSTA